MLGAPTLAACSDETDVHTPTPPPVPPGSYSPESPPVCDDECPSVENAGGSITKTLTLVAQGGTRTYTVDGEDVTVHVSTYNDSCPDPPSRSAPRRATRRARGMRTSSSST